MCSNADVAKWLAPGVLAKAKEEFEKLKPHFERLNAGKGSQGKGDQKRETVGGLKRKMKDADSKLVLPTAAESEESANHVYARLAAGTNSNLRMVMNITSLGGVKLSWRRTKPREVGSPLRTSPTLGLRRNLRVAALAHPQYPSRLPTAAKH